MRESQRKKAQFLTKDDLQELVFDFNVENPVQYTRIDLKKVIGKGPYARLSADELIILHLTNDEILEGKIYPPTSLKSDPKYYEPLKDNWNNFKEIKKTFPSHLSARRLDDYGTYMPIESTARCMTIINIISGKKGKDIDLHANYDLLLIQYERTKAKSDIQLIYDAVKGAFTNKPKLWAGFHGKDRNQIKILEKAFITLMKEKKESLIPWTRNGKPALYNWVIDDLSGGDILKFNDYYYSRDIKKDHKYYWWNKFIKDSDEEAKNMIKNGNTAFKVIGYANQLVFATAGEINRITKEAADFWMDMAASSRNPLLKRASQMMFIFAIVGGSFGSKALDPTLPFDEQEEGIFDLALTVGTFGAGKMLGSVAKGARAAIIGGKVLKKIAPIIKTFKKSVFVAKNLFLRLPKIARKSEKIMALSSKLADYGKRIMSRFTRSCGRSIFRLRPSFLETKQSLALSAPTCDLFAKAATKSAVSRADDAAALAKEASERLRQANGIIRQGPSQTKRANQLIQSGKTAAGQKQAVAASRTTSQAQQTLKQAKNLAQSAKESAEAATIGSKIMKVGETIIYGHLEFTIKSASLVVGRFAQTLAAFTPHYQILVKAAKNTAISVPQLLPGLSKGRKIAFDMTSLFRSPNLLTSGQTHIAKALVQGGARVNFKEVETFIKALHSQGLAMADRGRLILTKSGNGFKFILSMPPQFVTQGDGFLFAMAKSKDLANLAKLQQQLKALGAL